MKQINHEQLLRSIHTNYRNDRLRAMETGKDFSDTEDTYFKILLLIQMATKEVKEPELNIFPILTTATTGTHFYSDELEQRELRSITDDEFMQWLYDKEH